MFKLIFLILSVPAFGNSLIVDDVDGTQKRIDAPANGKVDYYDKSKIVFNTDTDGPIPKDVALGGLARSVDQASGKVNLVLDPIKKGNQDAAAAAKAANEAGSVTKKTRFAVLLDAQNKRDLSLAELNEFLRLQRSP